MLVCTIVARNYLAQARVLAESFAAHHPGRRLSALVVDGEVGEDFEAADEPFELVRLSDLPLPDREHRVMAAIYDVTELSTAVKPWLLLHLLERREPVIYLDPDIDIFAPLDELDPLALERGIVLTPHARSPVPRDGRKPSADDLSRAGIYNLGFVTVAPGAEDFLRTWGEELRRDCLISFDEGLFVDQRPLDFLPGHHEHHVLRDPSYNVAYWNLHERDVGWTGERYEVEGQPLRFFHFSGFDPVRPHLLSKHQGDRPRILLSERAGVARICAEYGHKLEAAGHAELRQLNYGFARTASGIELDKRARRAYREAVIAADEVHGATPPDPFDPAEADAFVELLRSPPPGGRVSRYLSLVWAERTDLRTAFPDLQGADAPGFLDWVQEDGATDPPIAAAFLPRKLRFGRVARRLTRSPAARGRSDGVNVAGYLRAELGIGEAARLLIAGLRAAGVPYSLVHYGATSNRQHAPFDDPGSGPPEHPVNIVCVNADRLPHFLEQVGPAFTRDRYTIGVWFWEVEEFPEVMRASAQFLDEIWVASRHTAMAIAPVVTRPVLIAPFPVVPPDPPERTKADFGLPDAFAFLFTFDFNSILERKNPIGLVTAFCRAFEPGEGPVLVLKTINGDVQTTAAEQLRAGLGGRSDIVLIDEYLSADDRHALTNVCDAYVSLHRSEGLGLTMAEAMALAKPVIATGYSGNLEFMTPHNSYLVPYEYTEVPHGADPYPAGARWADPDLAAAARLMRHVVGNPEDAREKGRRAARDIRARCSPEETARFLRRRLETLRRERGARSGRTEVPSAPEPSGARLTRAAVTIAAGPPTSTRAGVRLYQRLLRRLLRSHVEHNREAMSLLVESVGQLASEVAELTRDVDGLYAQQDATGSAEPDGEAGANGMPAPRSHAGDAA